MSRAEAAPFTRVAVIAPNTRVDVALPADVPVVDLLPHLLDMVGERSGDVAQSGWVLSSVDGHPLAVDRTLRSLDVLDGTPLRLTTDTEAAPAPVYDDVVDAIAATVQERSDTRPLRETGIAVLSAAAVSTASALLWLANGDAVVAALAALIAVVSLGSGTLIARRSPHRLAGVTIAVAGSLAAGAAGWLAVPGSSALPAALLGSSAMTVYAVAALLMLGSGAIAVTAVATAASLATVSSLVGLLAGASGAHTATAASAVALAMLPLLPWAAVRMSRLPMPLVPTTAEELREAPLTVDVADVQRRAAIASELFDGTAIGCAMVSAGGIVAAASLGTTLGAAYAAVAVAALLMRVRVLPSRRTRVIVMVIGAVAGAVATILAAGSSGPSGQMLAVFGCLAVLAGTMVSALTGQNRRPNPMAGRSLDLLEGLVLVAVLPLAVAATGLLSWVRHL